jgi:hypothetical protein
VRAKLGVALADMVAIDGDGLGWTVYEGVVWVRRKLMTAKKRAKQAGSPIILEAKACARRQRNQREVLSYDRLRFLVLTVKDSTTALAAQEVSIGVGESGLQGLRPTICSARAVAKISYLHMESVYVAMQLALQASAGAFLWIAPRSRRSVILFADFVCDRGL